MGKKQKGRKQILQLKEDKAVTNPGPSVNKEKESTPLDSKVADFLKEIDALTVTEESVAEENIPHVEKDKLKEGEILDEKESKLKHAAESVDNSVSEAEPAEKEEAYCAWREIEDGSTGYCYYWNMTTNEVTWEMPAEYLEYKRSSNLALGKETEQDESKDESFNTLQKKKISQIKEGSIIPITYYEGSSSDESASDDSMSEKFIKKESRSEKSSSSGLIGPLLPPDFQFPNDVPASIEDSEIDSTNNNPISVQESVQESAEFEITSSLPKSGDSVKIPVSYSESDSNDESPSTLHETVMKDSKDCEDAILANKEIPDSTVDTIAEKLITGVVDYDSCTDEEDVSSVNNIKSAVVEYDNSTDEDDSACVSDVSVIKPDVVTIEASSMCENSQHITENMDFETSAMPTNTSNGNCELMDISPCMEETFSLNHTASVKLMSSETEEPHQDCNDDVNGGNKLIDITNEDFPMDETDIAKVEGEESLTEKHNSQAFTANVKHKSSFLKEPQSCNDKEAPPNLAEQKCGLNHTASMKRTLSDSEDLKEDCNEVNSGIKKVKYSDFKGDWFPYVCEKHSYSSQQGLGFKKANFEENSSEKQQSTSFKKHLQNKDYKSVNFVKAKQVLELNAALNEKDTDALNEKDTDASNKKDPDASNKKDPDASNENNIGESSKNTHSEVSDICNNSLVESLKCDAENKSNISLADYDEESIDAIDRALCEAMEAKKLASSTKISTKNSPIVSEQASPVGSEQASPNISGSSCVIVDQHSSLNEENSDTDSDIIEIYSSGPSTSSQPADHSSGVAMTAAWSKIQLQDEAYEFLFRLKDLTTMYPNRQDLNLIFIELKTRTTDLSRNVLDTQYFSEYLFELRDAVIKFENSHHNGGWLFTWNNRLKKYFLLNPQYDVTLEAREVILNAAGANHTIKKIAKVSRDISAPFNIPYIEQMRDSPFNITSVYDESKASNHSDTSPTPPPPGVDTPPPPPSCSPPPTSPPPPPCSPPPNSPPPPPPPDSTEDACKLPEDMDLENSNDSCTYPILSNDTVYEANQIQYSSMTVSSTNNLENNLADTSKESISSMLQPSYSDTNVISDCIQISSLSSSCSIDETPVVSSESLFSNVSKNDVENDRTVSTSECLQTNSNINLCQSSSFSTKSNLSNEVKGKITQTTSKPKKEKKKTKLLSVLALKKKNIPLLVEKWQKIREEQEKEDKLERS